LFDFGGETVKKTAKRLLSLTLTLMIIMSAIACGFGGVTASAATFADLNQSGVWIKQSQSGPCVLDACAMMIRRTLIGTGNSNWSSVTES
jgi:Na+-driven multidrug efflux pump